MKRLNPITGKTFKRGDTRTEDNKVFKKYGSVVSPKTKKYYEEWLSPEKFEEFLKKKYNSSSENQKKNRELFKRGKLFKRKNPKTGKFFRVRELREDGYHFRSYDFRWSKGKYVGEIWISPEKTLRTYISHTFINVEKRSREKKIPMNIDIDYLLKIFPKDYLCPISGKKMIWGEINSKKNSSPSVDRIYPNLGYIKGNLRWISNECNILKKDRNFELLEKIYYDFKKIKNKSK